MTTECLPCQESLARKDIQDSVPDTDASQSAEWSGPIGMENQRTGDGRLIEANALRWDTLPVPLRWAMQDFGAHDGAYVVGKIESIERLSYEEANERLESTGRDALPEAFKDAVIVWGEGSHDLGSEYGREAFRQADEGLTPGVSMDLDDILVKEDDGDSFTILEGRVRAATQVAIPAFEGARISVAKDAREAFDSDEQRLADADLLVDEESFNWVEDAGGLPPYIKRIQKHLEKKGMDESRAIATAVNVVKKMCATGDTNFPGSQQVNAGSRAEACAAVADWEKKKAEHGTESIVASAGWLPPAEWFQDPHLDGPTGLTVDDDGRVYGHIALWGTCHVANPQGRQVCTQPPHSPSKYSAGFHLGVTNTTEGPLPTGKITLDTLHAGPKLSFSDTVYHYEHTGNVAAHVRAGEDAHGIWVAGAARPGVDLDVLRAAPVSGDWRTIGGSLEMVAALSVNVPGFPVPRAQALVASGSIHSLVASGMVEVEERTEEVLDLPWDDDAVLSLRDRFRALDRKEKADALAAKVSRLHALERVRRLRASLPQAAFAGHDDQWRVPKGNPDGGRYIDMPDAGVKDLETTLQDALDGGGVDDNAAADIGQSLDNAVQASEKASDALRNNDGAGATAAATEADKHLSDLEAKLQDAADSGAIDENTAATIGEKLDVARTSVGVVKDSDLSLLGDDSVNEGGTGDIGGDAKPGKGAGDIGGGDAPAEHPAGPAGEHLSKAEAGLQHAADSGMDEGQAAQMGDALDNAHDAITAHNSNPTEANKQAAHDAISNLEAHAGNAADSGAMDEGTAAGVGEALDNAHAAVDAHHEANAPKAPAAPDAGPQGSAAQQASTKAQDTASALEANLQDAADGGMDEESAAQVGEHLDAFRSSMDKLHEGIQGGNYNAQDLADAQTNLSALEASMMDAADKPGMSDETANGLGVALDDMFNDLGTLAQSLQGSSEPPPFATRKYVRQWLGRRGIRLGTFSRREG